MKVANPIYIIFQNFTLSAIILKFIEGKKKSFLVFYLRCNTDHNIYSLKSNWDHKVLIMVSCIEIDLLVFELKPKKEA